MTFLPKVRKAKAMTNFRGIALMHCVAKWYTASLMVLLSAHVLPELLQQVMVLAYIGQCNTMMVVAPLMHLTCKVSHTHWPLTMS